jgi:hypothetical protein
MNSPNIWDARIGGKYDAPVPINVADKPRTLSKCLRIAVFIGFGLLPRRIDPIVLVGLAITFANELTMDRPIIEKLLMADDSGLFALGLMSY